MAKITSINFPGIRLQIQDTHTLAFNKYLAVPILLISEQCIS